MKKILNILIILVLSSSFIYSQYKNSDINISASNDHYNFISVNEVKMFVSNNGAGSFSPTAQSGFYWPGGINGNKTAIYKDGLIFGGKINGQLFINGNAYAHGLQAGKILNNGLSDDPSLSKYRVYKILKNWEDLPPGQIRDAYELDYNEWPVEDGAPWIDVDNDGVYTPGIDKPHFIGDEVLWYVANDLDTSRTNSTFGTLPVGLEFQTTIYAFDSTNFLKDVVFKKYRIINKSNFQIDSLILSYWSDDDLGNAYDDFSGSDPYFNMGYTYNSTNNDQIYGEAPPAISHMFVQGPKYISSQDDSAFFDGKWVKGFSNLPMTSFMFYDKGSNVYRFSQTPNHFYNNMKGILWYGAPVINPITNTPTVFPLNGNPNIGGWYEGSGWPGGINAYDRYTLINSGPVTLAAGDTQEVVIAIFIGQGNDNIQSVYSLKEKAGLIQNFYGAFVPNVTSVNNNENNIPIIFVLEQNYPNPFNPSTEIRYQITEDRKVSLIVYDILGNKVATLVNEFKTAGSYNINFDASNLSSGVYFYQLSAVPSTNSGNIFVSTKKMLLIK